MTASELTHRRRSGTLVTMRMLAGSLVSWVTLGVIAVSTCANIGNPLTGPTEYDSLSPGWQSK